MSMGPRREQRAVAIAMQGDGQRALEGLFVAGGAGEVPGAVIAPPHPLYGGSMDSPLVNELAHAFWQNDIASLCFNWRGVGASAGEASGEASDARADYGAALEYLSETVSGSLVACGYSFGAATAVSLMAITPRVRRSILVAPPPAMLDSVALASFSGPVLIIAGSKDAFAPLAEIEALTAAGDCTELVTIPEADHFFLSGLAQVGRVARDWIERTS